MVVFGSQEFHHHIAVNYEVFTYKTCPAYLYRSGIEKTKTKSKTDQEDGLDSCRQRIALIVLFGTPPPFFFKDP